jgi:uncharacterized membrane protein
MNAAHLHLMLNHVPVLAIPFGAAVLAWAMWRQRPEFARLAMTVFLLSAVATIPTYVTGEPAEGAIDGVAGAIEPWVEAHEQAALASLILGAALGVLALVALWRGRATPEPSRPMLAASLALALVTAGSLAYTANLGGHIRHTELRSGAALAGAASGGEHGE